MIVFTAGRLSIAAIKRAKELKDRNLKTRNPRDTEELNPGNCESCVIRSERKFYCFQLFSRPYGV